MTYELFSVGDKYILRRSAFFFSSSLPCWRGRTTQPPAQRHRTHTHTKLAPLKDIIFYIFSPFYLVLYIFFLSVSRCCRNPPLCHFLLEDGHERSFSYVFSCSCCLFYFIFWNFFRILFTLPFFFFFWLKSPSIFCLLLRVYKNKIVTPAERSLIHHPQGVYSVRLVRSWMPFIAFKKKPTFPNRITPASRNWRSLERRRSMFLSVCLSKRW